MKLGNLFLDFIEGDNVSKVATGRLSMILDIVRSVKRTLATYLVYLGSMAESLMARYRGWRGRAASYCQAYCYLLVE